MYFLIVTNRHILFYHLTSSSYSSEGFNDRRSMSGVHIDYIAVFFTIMGKRRRNIILSSFTKYNVESLIVKE